MADLAEVLDRVLDAGAAVDGGVLISLAGVELARLNLRLLLTSTETAQRLGGADPYDASTAPALPADLPPLPLDPLRRDGPQDALAGLLVGLAELLHRVLESQVLARAEAGSLTEDQERRLGRALAAFDARLEQIRSALTSPQEKGLR